ncbi:protein of unknown function [Bradyrhizobium sp. ORS 285]|uniref:hypothetical protein n=1 Tax=Bradyrhizobium sp. ORS 285 TaxID=115808 RepID=UPI0002408F82|nr:hypothetical protein [Bradyrhizobium sp. ORS 285]CCD87469.1 hypothetical protein BRAO285_2360003 [Bradyrhizobium sp. ORS 285]SMX56392.1 protein of unknown function [Bradyrhizobium sp. ORS 285]
MYNVVRVPINRANELKKYKLLNELSSLLAGRASTALGDQFDQLEAQVAICRMAIEKLEHQVAKDHSQPADQWARSFSCLSDELKIAEALMSIAREHLSNARLTRAA